MQKLTHFINPWRGGWPILLLTLFCSAFFAVNATAFTVNVVDQNGLAIPGGFKWLLEENNTHDPAPGIHLPVDNDTTPGSGAVFNNTLSISLHKSHAAVVASGEEPTASATTITTDASGSALAPGRYFLSVLPFGSADTTYDMGGTTVTVPGPNVTVYVRTNPIETAQVSKKVFHDGGGPRALSGEGAVHAGTA